MNYLKQNPAIGVRIEGHADPRGSDDYNKELSERRVKAVSEALVQAGIPAGRIATGAFGEQKPKCQEQNEACWQRDRRVAVFVTPTSP